MVCVGIDVAKDKHDCCILDSDGTIRADCITIPNNMDGFKQLLQTIRDCTKKSDKIKVGLEATGHYSYNILGFLLDNDLAVYVMNPLHTNLYRKSLSLRKTKTDRVDARTIATMLLSDVDLKSYTDTAYHNEELKSLTRYRFDKVRERAKLKQSVSRLVTILFPELEKLVPSLHIASVYALLSEYPGAKQISEIHLTKLTNLLATASKGRYGKDKAIQIRDAARTSIGSVMPAKFLELKHMKNKIIGVCPNCGKPVVEREKGWFCENRECRFVLWKDNAFLKRLGKRMDAHVADKLLRDGRVRLKDCKSAKGKTYNATVLLSCEADGRSKFSLEFEGGC